MTSCLLENIDGYKIFYNQIVGSGAYAQVYMCKNPDINESICVKVLALNSIHQALFKREVEVLRKIKEINHNNLIKIYHIAEQDSIVYIFMKKCQFNLEQWFAKKKSSNKILTIEEILNIVQQIVNGYKQLYNNKIIHRDLKPANILIGDDGCLKISDFGLGKVIEELEQAGQHSMVGSPIFASPQCLMNGNYSSKTDVYSLGAIIYYLTFGEHIFKGQNLYQITKQMETTILQNSEIKIPNITNEGNQDQIFILVNLLKLTITYDEKTRIEWENLFNQFNLEQDLIPDSSKINQCQIEQMTKQQEEIRKSQSNQIFLQNRPQEQQRCKENFVQSEQFEQISNSNQWSNCSATWLQGQMQNQQLQVSLPESYLSINSLENNQNIPSNPEFQMQQNQNIFCQQKESSPNLSRQSPTTFEKQLISHQNTIIVESFQSETYQQEAYFAEQFLKTSQSLVLFTSQKMEQSSTFIFQGMKKVIQNKLVKKSPIVQFIEVILAKGSLATKILEFLAEILMREELRCYRQWLKALQLLMAGYNYSIILLGYCVGCNDPILEQTTFGIEMRNQFSEKIIADYINNQSQEQRNSLRVSLHSALNQIKDLMDNYHNNVQESYSYPSIKIYQLFSNYISYLNYRHFAIQYQSDFNQLFDLITQQLVIVQKTDHIFLKQSEQIFRFIVCSFKFINNESQNQQPINNYMSLDLDSIKSLNDNINKLIENVQSNLPKLCIQ